MDSIYYVLIILGISFGLIVLYIILRGMKVIGAIPVISSIIDPILNAPSVMMAQAGHIMTGDQDPNDDLEDLGEEYGFAEDDTYEGKFPVKRNAVVKSERIDEKLGGFGEILYIEANSHDVDLWRSVRNHMQENVDYDNPQLDSIAVNFGDQVMGAVDNKPKRVKIAIIDFGDTGMDLNLSDPDSKRIANKVRKQGFAPVGWDEEGEELWISPKSGKMMKNQK